MTHEVSTRFLSKPLIATSYPTLARSSNTDTPGTATTTRTHLHTLHHAHAQILKSIQIFKVHEILFILMGAIANLDELKLILKKELRQEILTEVLDIIRDEFYPPEEKIRKEFVKKVEAAERRVKEGKFTQYTPKEFEKSFL
jgi:hypothetical protein